MVGDIVRVVDDMSLVHRLQEAGPGWNDDMACVRAASACTCTHVLRVCKEIQERTYSRLK